MPVDGDVRARLQGIEHALRSVVGGGAEVEVLTEAVAFLRLLMKLRQKIIVD